jgi:hypothetical protein
MAFCGQGTLNGLGVGALSCVIFLFLQSFANALQALFGSRVVFHFGHAGFQLADVDHLAQALGRRRAPFGTLRQGFP